MILRRFSIQVIIRVVLLIANIFLFTSIFGNEDLFFNQLILSLLFIFQTGELIHYINYTNRELARIFTAIRHSDFSISFMDNHRGKSFRALHGSFTEIIAAYKKVKIEKEIQYQFLQRLINQINVGIISIHQDNIELINPRAEDFLSMTGVKNWNVARQLHPAIVRELDAIGDQGRKLLEVPSERETKIIAVDVSMITILEKPHRLITLQDINSEIEQKEIEAWHKLIRILTHEIMNSVTPLASLTETMQGFLVTRDGTQKKASDLKDETISDMRFSLNTIQKRSEGLLHFVENFRKLSKVPKPEMTTIKAAELLSHINSLFSVELTKESITLKTIVSEKDLVLTCDPMLIEQVLINMITNSIHALSAATEKNITLSAYPTNTGPIIEVTDNGTGIPAKELSEIFVPFFSTKKDGSGIGLSLSKQIMRVHGGNIKVDSSSEKGTSFFLQFKGSSNPVGSFS